MLTIEGGRREAGTSGNHVRSVSEHLARIRALETTRRRWIGALLGSAVLLALLTVR